ncbi:MAG: hypothetical protein VKL39_20520 [Leptolyngbyaceae bacterium]|nr:hypothetical protein [Leptolyngbyaceae bacterium]
MNPEERQTAIRQQLRTAFGPKFSEKDRDLAAQITELMNLIEDPRMLLQLSRQFISTAEQKY